jgi:hypothetical protein
MKSLWTLIILLSLQMHCIHHESTQESYNIDNRYILGHWVSIDTTFFPIHSNSIDTSIRMHQFEYSNDSYIRRDSIIQKGNLELIFYNNLVEFGSYELLSGYIEFTMDTLKSDALCNRYIGNKYIEQISRSEYEELRISNSSYSRK